MMVDLLDDTIDLLAVERPVVRLGDTTIWLGDVTESRRKKLAKAEDAIQSLAVDADASIEQMARAIGAKMQVVAETESGGAVTGLAELFAGLVSEKRAKAEGRVAHGALFLRRAHAALESHLTGRDLLGEV